METATQTLRSLERASIRAFIEDHSDHLTGRVLDYGCGKQPYRDVIEAAGGWYVGYDRAGLPANVSKDDRGPDDPLDQKWDAVLCTQVIQYALEPTAWLSEIRGGLKPGGALVITGPTNWPIVEVEDRWRFTLTGIASLLNNAGFIVDTVDERAAVEFQGELWALGWGAVGFA